MGAPVGPDQRSLLQADPEIAALVAGEAQRQSDRLELVASENYISAAQFEVSGSVLGNTTVEGYPGARFLAASPEVDRIEKLAIERACKLFNARFANVQPHSGTQANQAVFLALLRPGDSLLSMSLAAGGHFSHGERSTMSGQWFQAHHYGVDARTDLIDYEQARELARQHRPRLIIAGASAYPRSIDFARFAAIAREVGAHLMVDIAHVAGLVATGHFPNPLPHADIVTSTTYKNFRGVRGGLILCNDPVLAARLDAAVCPGLQGTPLMNQIAAKAVAFGEALRPDYKRYSEQVLRNVRALGRALEANGIPLLTGGSDVPFLVADLRSAGITGGKVVAALDAMGVGSNAAPVAGDTDFAVARGIRLGVSAITTRGMQEAECVEIARLVAAALSAAAQGRAPSQRDIQAVTALCRRFPVAPPAAGNPTTQGHPMNDIRMLIGGERTASSSGRTFERRNPLDGKVATRAPAATAREAVAAVEAAAKAFPAWSAMGPSERRGLLLKAAAALEARTPQFIEAMAAETGASAPWAGFNAHLAAGMLQEAASITTQIGGEVIPSDVPGSLAMGLRVPAGVVLGIAPWNAPVILGVRAIATPLACGNTVILKGSELCPATHGLIIEALQEAGLPPGVVNFVTNAPADAGEVVEAMIAHPAVKRINFTGSTKVGRIIAQTCAKYLKPAVLELGGKAPFVVLDDADVEAAVNAAIFGSFANSGQICMSTERVIVDSSIADAFVTRLAARAAALPLGDPRKGPVVLGSVIDMGTVERCNALIDDALAKGATLVCGGKSESTLMAATVLDHVTADMKIYHEESFGPVKPVVRVDGLEAAVTCANDNPYGLSAAVFGRDVARALQVARRIESGICHVNGPTVHDEAHMPFGGVKDSGYGRFGGRAGIEAFTELRWITIQTTARSYPF
ncbi:MAG: vanillin dehydrogenase [Ramlibacter sp.]|nr:vanillin dehydrogenase [Ramlibacter sp.]